MTNRYMQSAFDAVCKDAEEPKSFWLSLYARVPFYGGPEEGGWWGEDVELCASQEFNNQEAVDAAKEKVQALADDLAKQARRSYGEQCCNELEWLEERGLESDFLPEPDGPTRYYVAVESIRGSHESRGGRHYE